MARTSTAPQGKKRGRPSNSADSANTKKSSAPSGQSQERGELQASRKRKRPLDAEGTGNEQSERQGDRPSQQRRDDVGDDQYQHLKAVTRRVPRQTIDSKWTPLPTTAINRLNTLLGDVERSVAMRLRDERKRNQASTAVQTVTRKLERKLKNGLPFPPATRAQREEDFDFEKILAASRALELQLTPMLHSIELLKAERAKEEALLEADREKLASLEANAESEASRRKRLAKKLHPLLDPEHTHGHDAGDDASWIKPSNQPTVQIQDDEALQPILSQLGQHLDSMDSNLSQVQGIDDALIATKVSLQDVLYTHLDRASYDQVVAGE